MKLTFDPSDLRPEFQRGEGNDVDQAISTRNVTFEKLSDKAQAALRIVGRGVFWAWDRQTYNAVYPPK